MTVQVPIDKKNVLVLGGAGFLGSHLCEFLLKKGDNVICVDNFVSSDVENIKLMLEFPNFEFIRHDVTEQIDYRALPELRKFKIKAQGVQEIYNLACPTSPEDFTRLPIKTSLSNSLGVVNSLEWAREFQAKILLASSSAVYGEPADQEAIHESFLGKVNFIGPRACYNEGKRFAETLMTTYGQHYKMDYRIARIFTTYGPRMKLLSGRQVPDFIYNALTDREIVIRGDEHVGSSLCYVKDIVEGLAALMESPVKEPVNLGGDKFHTYHEVATMVLKMTNSDSKLTHGDPIRFSHRQAVPDISLAKEKIGWFPLVSLEEGLRESITYAQSNLVRMKGFDENEVED